MAARLVPPIINPGTGLGMSKLPRKGLGRNRMILSVFPTVCESGRSCRSSSFPGRRWDVYIYTYQ